MVLFRAKAARQELTRADAQANTPEDLTHGKVSPCAVEVCAPSRLAAEVPHVDSREVVPVTRGGGNCHPSPDGALKRLRGVRAKLRRDTPVGRGKAHHRRSEAI